MGIVAPFIGRAYHFLQEHGHLLLVDDVARGGHVSLAVLVEHRGVDGLDGIHQEFETLGDVVNRRNHVGRIDAGKGLVVRIFEEGRRADGNGLIDHLEIGNEVCAEALGEGGPEESGENFVIGGFGEGQRIEVALLHELVEDVRTEHNGLGELHLCPGEVVQVGMAQDDVVEEGQAASLAAQRTVADAGKVAVTVEAVAVEYGHNALVLHATVADDGIKDNLPVGIDVLKGVPRDVAQELGDGKEGAGTQPARNVVVADVVEERFLREREDIVLQVLQVADAHFFVARAGLAENEVAKAEVAEHEVAEVIGRVLGVLVDEGGPAALCIVAFVRFGALHDERQVGVGLAHGGEELEACQLVGLAFAGEAAVADYTERVGAVAAVEFPSLFVVAGQNDFGSAAHTQHFELRVEGFGGKLETLLEHKLVEVGKDGGIVADGILHKEYHLHAGLQHVLFEVHFVLDELDDGEQEVGIAQPAEDILKDTEVLVLHAPGDAVAEGGQHHQRDLGETLLDVAGNAEHIVVFGTGHTDDEVEGSALEFNFGFFGRSHLEEARRKTEAEFGIFVKNFLVYTSVVFEHERIVGIGYDEDIADAPHHEVGEGRIAQYRTGLYVFLGHGKARRARGLDGRSD